MFDITGASRIELEVHTQLSSSLCRAHGRALSALSSRLGLLGSLASFIRRIGVNNNSENGN